VSDAASTPINRQPRLDGLRNDTPPASRLHAAKKPSILKPSQLPDTEPEFTDPDLVDPQPPASRKRKRSPSETGLKTTNNPPLNDDCVIAFAESVNKTDERGVLRQVKMERLGNFVEDSVVYAVRFFVAGDGSLDGA
jgi:hypothetical protein